MSALTKFPWLSWLSLMLIYAVFGWLLISDSLSWENFAFEQLRSWGFKVSLEQLQNAFRWSIVITHVIFILLVTDVFSAPDIVLKLFVRNPWNSNFLTFIYILVLSFLFTVVLGWFYYLVRFFILTAVALLVRTDMQKVNFSRLQASITIACSGLLSFSLGVLAFDQWGLIQNG